MSINFQLILPYFLKGLPLTMFGYKSNIFIISALVSLLSVQALSQQIKYPDSLSENNSEKVNLKPHLQYEVGSSFTSFSHLGTISGLTMSPILSIPVSPKLLLNGGVIAGRFYSTLQNFNPESEINRAYAELSVYGSAIYSINSQLTVYGTGIKQLTSNSPYYSLPKSSYSIGSTYNFGDFSIGVTLRMSKWNDTFSSSPFNDSQEFYSPFMQRRTRMNFSGW